MPLFSADDHAARKAALGGTAAEWAEYGDLARRIAGEIVEDLLEEAKRRFRAGEKDIRTLNANDRSPSSEHSPYIPDHILKAVLLPLLARAFEMQEDEIILQSFPSIGGDFISGTYESSYRRISLRIDFKRPLT